MFPRAKSVRHTKGHQVEVTFANGERHLVPLDEIVNRESEQVRPLKNVNYFAKVFVNPESGNLEWPNGYDICPDILYWLATGKPIRFATDRKYHRPPSHLQKSAQNQKSARKKAARQVS